MALGPAGPPSGNPLPQGLRDWQGGLESGVGHGASRGESCGSVWMSVRVPTAGRACLCSGSGGAIRDRPHSWGLSALTILAGSFPSRSHSSWQSPLVTGTGSEPSVLYTHRRLDQGSLCPGMASLILGAVPK